MHRCIIIIVFNINYFEYFFNLVFTFVRYRSIYNTVYNSATAHRVDVLNYFILR